jgi:TatD DNase family protein
MNSNNGLIDTHVHLNMLIPDKTRDRIISAQEIIDLKPYVERAQQTQIKTMINVGTSYIESMNSIAIAKEYQNIFATIGIHPCDSDDAPWEKDFEKLTKLLLEKKEHKIVGIGETGLDFYHKPFDQNIQQASFIGHIETAIEHKLPLVIHVREAADGTLDLLKNYSGKINGVIHCFSQSYDFAKQVLDWGLLLGIDAPITYPKNHALRDVVKKVPLDRLILETDAPFLPPQHLRGKKNEPANLVSVVEQIALIKECTQEQVAQITTKTAQDLFQL